MFLVHSRRQDIPFIMDVIQIYGIKDVIQIYRWMLYRCTEWMLYRYTESIYFLFFFFFFFFYRFCTFAANGKISQKQNIAALWQREHLLHKNKPAQESHSLLLLPRGVTCGRKLAFVFDFTFDILITILYTVCFLPILVSPSGAKAPLSEQI